MKRSLFLLIILLLSIGLFGCEMKGRKSAEDLETQKNITSFNRVYYDKNHMSGEMSLEEITLYEDNTVFKRDCEVKSSCTFYRGTFEVTEDKLFLDLTESQDNNGVWNQLNNSIHVEYEITEHNTFGNTDGDYVREFVLMG